MALNIRRPKVADFINLSKAEEILPKFMTKLKSVSISSNDVVVVDGVHTLSDIDLLKGIDVSKYRYVGVLGVVVSGEWMTYSKVRGAVTVSLVDKRMTNAREAIIGCYKAQAKERNFSFKLVPNYFVTATDAVRKPWQLLVQLNGLRMDEGWSALSLEVVSVCICANSIVSKGLRERVLTAGEGSVDFEKVVDDFVDNVPSFASLSAIRNKGRTCPKPVNHPKNRPQVQRRKPAVQANRGVESNFVIEDDVGSEVSADSNSFSTSTINNDLYDQLRQSSRLHGSVVGGAQGAPQLMS
ncbi:movement protein [Hoya necrotic spot virus]|uniref:Movement protein n=2 Tax=Hoya tobamovirus 2 TaxID=2764945 RepID=A0A7G7Y2Q7_9VIRU|nr:putative movement protein [Hoya tobamovirus 2]QOC69616.1 movement protein [Hoya necrotic spot virus]WPT07543.1 movement protein [Hoya tobamovirus 2]